MLYDHHMDLFHRAVKRNSTVTNDLGPFKELSTCENSFNQHRDDALRKDTGTTSNENLHDNSSASGMFSFLQSSKSMVGSWIPEMPEIPEIIPNVVTAPFVPLVQGYKALPTFSGVVAHTFGVPEWFAENVVETVEGSVALITGVLGGCVCVNGVREAWVWYELKKEEATARSAKSSNRQKRR